MGYQLTAEERLEIFGRWDPPASYAEDLAERQGSGVFASVDGPPTPQSKEEWQAIEDRRRAFAERLHAAMEAGLAPTSPEAMALVEEMRDWMTKDQQLLVAEWYAEKPEYFGFIARPGEQLPGMPEWHRDAVRASTPS
nr:TipAS antibiotic-recognition domain-containing protein [Actinopolymorpha alba]